MENSCGLSGGVCVDHPRLSATLVFKQRSRYKSLSAVFCKRSAVLGLVMNKQLHVDKDKMLSSTIMLSVDVGIEQYVWVDIGVAEQ